MFARRLGRLLGAKLAQKASSSWPTCTVGQAANESCSCRTYFRDSREYVHFKRERPLHIGFQKAPDPQRAKVIAVVVFGGVAIFWYRSRQEIPYTHRVHHVFITPNMEKSLGESNFKQLKQQARSTGKLLSDAHPTTKLVKKVGQRIIAKATDGHGGGYQEHLKNLDWEFAVIKSDMVNAMVLPGGKVVVFTGLFKAIDVEDELAAVLGHEAGHVVARHIAERISALAILEILRLAILVAFGLDIPPIFTDLIFSLPNSRKHEKEADVIGMDLAARACFEPGAAMTMFTKLGALEKAQGVRIPTFLRTHPQSEERVQALLLHLPEARYLAELEGCELNERPALAAVPIAVPRTGVGPPWGPKPRSEDPFDW